MEFLIFKNSKENQLQDLCYLEKHFHQRSIKLEELTGTINNEIIIAGDSVESTEKWY